MNGELHKCLCPYMEQRKIARNYHLSTAQTTIPPNLKTLLAVTSGHFRSLNLIFEPALLRLIPQDDRQPSFQPRSKIQLDGISDLSYLARSDEVVYHQSPETLVLIEFEAGLDQAPAKTAAVHGAGNIRQVHLEICQARQRCESLKHLAPRHQQHRAKRLVDP